MNSPFGKAPRSAAWLILFGAAYVSTAYLSRALTLPNSYIGLIWAPNALLLSALVLAPRKSWWLVIAVAGIAHVLSMSGSTTWWRMAWQIPANGLFAMAGAETIRRVIGVPVRFERGRDVFVFTGLALALPFLLALVAPAFAMAAAGKERLFSPGIAFLRIALANVSPLLLVTPAVLLWARLGPESWRTVSRQRRIEVAAVIGSVLVTGVIAFGAGPELARFPWLLLLTFPPLI